MLTKPHQEHSLRVAEPLIVSRHDNAAEPSFSTSPEDNVKPDSYISVPARSIAISSISIETSSSKEGYLPRFRIDEDLRNSEALVSNINGKVVLPILNTSHKIKTIATPTVTITEVETFDTLDKSIDERTEPPPKRQKPLVFRTKPFESDSDSEETEPVIETSARLEEPVPFQDPLPISPLVDEPTENVPEPYTVQETNADDNLDDSYSTSTEALIEPVAVPYENPDNIGSHYRLIIKDCRDTLDLRTVRTGFASAILSRFVLEPLVLERHGANRICIGHLYSSDISSVETREFLTGVIHHRTDHYFPRMSHTPCKPKKRRGHRAGARVQLLRLSRDLNKPKEFDPASLDRPFSPESSIVEEVRPKKLPRIVSIQYLPWILREIEYLPPTPREADPFSRDPRLASRTQVTWNLSPIDLDPAHTCRYHLLPPDPNNNFDPRLKPPALSGDNNPHTVN
ncbi:hypothetical protein KPH14_000712 [Odynerus spinipes]|uniref:Uncharacterized protein n=1 Tax=Odynerus spinipes TaxID=1348599 RepID=A0AAD9RES9_9HYME|nr:hypothetical protein KPH14_000712 [Odynerus spinipes]